MIPAPVPVPLPGLVALLLGGAAVWIYCGGPGVGARSAVHRGTHPTPEPSAGAHPAGRAAASHRRPGKPGGSAEPVPLVLEMCATLLESGLPIRSVLRIIGSNVPGYDSLLLVSRALDLNVGWERAWSQGTGAARELEPALRLTQLSGAPAAALLRSSAAAARKRRIRQAEARGAEFGIKLVIPLGLCALPAFIALGVVPVVISLLPRF